MIFNTKKKKKKKKKKKMSTEERLKAFIHWAAARKVFVTKVDIASATCTSLEEVEAICDDLVKKGDLFKHTEFDFQPAPQKDEASPRKRRRAVDDRDALRKWTLQKSCSLIGEEEETVQGKVSVSRIGEDFGEPKVICVTKLLELE